jgi:hypothetical protein
MPLDLDTLRGNAEVSERLSWSFEFRIEDDPHEPVWFTVDGIKTIEGIGRDGAGGVFAIMPPSPRVLYVTSEGEAGIVAADLDEFIALLVACPYWHDLLHFSGNGQLEQMRRAATASEATFEDDEEMNEAREFLKSQLDLEDAADPVGKLHRAVSTSDVVVRSPHGVLCTSLFNSFTIDDNPLLRDFAD